jgi:hypothetical protein
MSDQDQAHEAALAEYKEVVAQFRALTDIRFKLLTYLPLGTVAAVFLSKEGQLVGQPAVAAFALVATLCIATYNKRNDQHYDELVARAAELERQNLHLLHGHFSNRPMNWLKYGPLSVEHRWPIGLLYAATAALWVFLLVRSASANIRVSPSTVTVIEWLAPAGVIACWLLLRKMESVRRKELRDAVYALKIHFDNRGSSNEVCQQIVAAIAAQKALFGLDPDMVERRAKHHWPAYASTQRLDAGANFLSAIIDLPARWIEDVWTGRR